MKRILYLALYPEDTAPSQRFRVEQFLPYWKAMGYEIDICPFYNAKDYNELYNKGHWFSKSLAVLRAFGQRMGLVLGRASNYDGVFIQRGATPIGPPIFEWYITNVLNKPLIYDFDDAIWMPGNTTSVIVKLLKSYSKVAKICRWSTVVLVGNEYLANYARAYNTKVKIIPTVIDTEERYKYKPQIDNPIKDIVVGWTGSHSTMPYLDIVIPYLELLSKKYDFQFWVISNREPSFQLNNLRYIPWNSETEIADLAQIDIGLMPLVDDEWAKGKCGFKAIQYMGLGKPAIVSAVGVNSTIVDHGVNGYLITNSKHDWLTYLERLLSNAEERLEMGQLARAKIDKQYSLQSQLAVYEAVFKEVWGE